MKRIFILAVSLLFVFSMNAQFRVVSQISQTNPPSFSAVDADTYTLAATGTSLSSDLTGNNYNGTGIQIGHRMIDELGNVFTVVSVTAFSAFVQNLNVDFYEGNNQLPSGQFQIYDPVYEEIPQIPFSGNGSTATLNAAIVTYNASKYGGGVATVSISSSNCIDTIFEINSFRDTLFYENVSGAEHYAFPSIARKASNIIIGFYNGTSHSTEGNSVYIRSNDLGATFSSIDTIDAFDGTNNYKNFIVKYLSDGRLLGTYWKQGGGLYCRISNNDGLTFSSRTEITGLGTLGTEGKPIETENRIIIPVYDVSDATSAGVVITDKQFSSFSLVEFPNNASLNETGLIYHQDTLFAFCRNEADTDGLYRTFSTDEGDTWSNPVVVNCPEWFAGKPAVELLSSGQIIINPRSRENPISSPDEGIVLISSDNGLNFHSLVEQEQRTFVYGSFVEVGNGQVLNVSASENSQSSLMQLRLYQTGGCDLSINNQKIQSSNIDLISNKNLPLGKNGLRKLDAETLVRGNSSAGSGEADFTNNMYDFLNGHTYEIGGTVNDATVAPIFRIRDNGDVMFGGKTDITPSENQFLWDKSQGSLVLGRGTSGGRFIEIGLSSLAVGFNATNRGENSILTGSSSILHTGSKNSIAALESSNVFVNRGIAFGQSLNSLSPTQGVTYGGIFGYLNTYGNVIYGLFGGSNSNFLGNNSKYGIFIGNTVDFTNVKNGYIIANRHVHTDASSERAEISNTFNSIGAFSTSNAANAGGVTNMQSSLIIGDRMRGDYDRVIAWGGNIDNNNAAERSVVLNGFVYSSAINAISDPYDFVLTEDSKFLGGFDNGYDFYTKRDKDGGMKIIGNTLELFDNSSDPAAPTTGFGIASNSGVPEYWDGDSWEQIGNNSSSSTNVINETADGTGTLTTAAPGTATIIAVDVLGQGVQETAQWTASNNVITWVGTPPDNGSWVRVWYNN